MTLDNYFYIECLAIEEWSYFHGWRESMTGIYLTRELGTYHQNIQVSYLYLGELHCNISFLMCFCNCVAVHYTEQIMPPLPPICEGILNCVFLFMCESICKVLLYQFC